jgi:hypothetical protein
LQVCVSFDSALTQGVDYNIELPAGAQYDLDAGLLKASLVYAPCVSLNLKFQMHPTHAAV